MKRIAPFPLTEIAERTDLHTVSKSSTAGSEVFLLLEENCKGHQTQ
jgi:hypothetical protein